MDKIVPYLPHFNASLNTLATVLLVAGYVLIKMRRETAHKWAMLSCFGVSTVFLISYLIYHSQTLSKKFPLDTPTAVRYFYYGMLLTHVVLAATVPFLAIATIYFALRDQRRRHLAVAKFTFPIWLYVSITGVGVYLMLYQFYAR